MELLRRPDHFHSACHQQMASYALVTLVMLSPCGSAVKQGGEAEPIARLFRHARFGQ